MNAIDIINKYYSTNIPLKETLLIHSQAVCDEALSVAHRHPELKLNETILETGAMLHDIGIFLTDAPSIHCFGKEPYLMHGYLGGQLLREEGMEAYARICERHTGTGLTKETIEQYQLPIPAQDYFPETIEEIVICYANKFYSKSHLERVKTPEQVYNSLLKFGKAQAETFKEWHERFK